MPLEEVVLVDHHEALVLAWSRAFKNIEQVSAEQRDFFAAPADAMVSPANSFGVMDGGLDLAIRGALGVGVQRRVQEMICERHHGEMPVGSADLVATGDERWPYLVVAPTMRVPTPISRTLNPYTVFRAILLAVRRHNDTASEAQQVRRLLCPGLGTGIGGVPAVRCAVQMKMAWEQVHAPARIPSFDRIWKVHNAMAAL